MTFDLGTLASAIGLAIPVGGVVGRMASWAVRKELNGTAQRVRNVDARTARIEDHLDKLGNRVTRLETIQEMHE